jgi:hypothetical protein
MAAATKDRRAKIASRAPLAQRIRICATCHRTQVLAERPKMPRCDGCRAVYYCSRKCQGRDWQKHKAACDWVKPSPSFTVDDVD